MCAFVIANPGLLLKMQDLITSLTFVKENPY